MRIGRTSMHNAWDNALPPIADIAPGELTVETAESSGGQLGRASGVADVGALDFGRVNPVTGPFRVDGARPGDALVIDILDVETADWGWTACIPGFGLLADDFPEAHLRISTISGGFAEPMPGVRVPVVPMVGTIGVAPAEPGEHSIVPPRRWGGNMDVRRGGAPATPVIETDPRTHRTGAALATTGIGPDLLRATRDAARALVTEVAARTGMAPADAYLLASIAADLKISEVVDAPNWIVSAHLELSLLP